MHSKSTWWMFIKDINHFTSFTRFGLVNSHFLVLCYKKLLVNQASCHSNNDSMVTSITMILLHVS